MFIVTTGKHYTMFAVKAIYKKYYFHQQNVEFSTS